MLERLLALDAEIRTATDALGVRQQLKQEIAETRAEIAGTLTKCSHHGTLAIYFFFHIFFLSLPPAIDVYLMYTCYLLGQDHALQGMEVALRDAEEGLVSAVSLTFAFPQS